MSANVALDDIHVGPRDRTDLGDIAGLAKSIKKVGLLHPVVVTASYDLIAGGRRLAAVRELGWTDVPVTVVDLTTVGAVLDAESDENTCRKSLAPTEALAARDRRTKALAEDASKRKGGRGRKAETSPKLGDVSRKARETSKAGANGSGYSGSTLDKVAVIRDAATAPTVRRDGKDVEVPEPVRETAKAALTDVSHAGASVDRAHQQVQAALDQHLPPDENLVAIKWNRAFCKALAKVNAVTQFTADDVAEKADPENVDLYDSVLTTLTNHHKRMTAARSHNNRLHVVGEGSR